MKLGVLTVLLQNQPAKEAFTYVKSLGAQAVEIGVGGFSSSAHCPVDELLASPAKVKEYKAMVEDIGLEISAFSVHGNPVHPVAGMAESYHNDYIKALRLAEIMGVNRVITFSGCPGGAPGDKSPNWVTCPWPDDYLGILQYQWNDVLIPYWEKAVALAKNHGIEKVALEMHPGFCVYNPETMLKLRAAVGPTLGANFDPSHLFWQGIDPVAAIRELDEAIYFMHAKDSKVDPANAAKNGVLDTKHYKDELHRSWIFRAVGYGHDALVWKDIISNLRMVGYDDVISIEHEDSLMSATEGLQKAITFMKDVLAFEPQGEMWWA